MHGYTEWWPGPRPGDSGRWSVIEGGIGRRNRRPTVVIAAAGPDSPRTLHPPSGGCHRARVGAPTGACVSEFEQERQIRSRELHRLRRLTPTCSDQHLCPDVASEQELTPVNISHQLTRFRDALCQGQVTPRRHTSTRSMTCSAFNAALCTRTRCWRGPPSNTW